MGLGRAREAIEDEGHGWLAGRGGGVGWLICAGVAVRLCFAKIGRQGRPAVAAGPRRAGVWLWRALQARCAEAKKLPG